MIELRGVDVMHPDGAAPLVRAVDWRIGPGEFWVVGASPGSGLSSLLLTAAGLNRPGAGTLSIFGRDLAAATEADQVEWRRRIGFVYERGGRLLSHLSVEQNIALPLAYHTALTADQIRVRTDEWLARAELQEYAASMPSQLSPRLQQRAALARALVVPSAVVLVDDPPVRLAGAELRWWPEQLAGLCQRGISVVVGSSLWRAWLPSMAHARFAVLQAQRFVELGTPDQVRAQSSAPWREWISLE